MTGPDLGLPSNQHGIAQIQDPEESQQFFRYRAVVDLVWFQRATGKNNRPMYAIEILQQSCRNCPFACVDHDHWRPLRVKMLEDRDRSDLILQNGNRDNCLLLASSAFAVYFVASIRYPIHYFSGSTRTTGILFFLHIKCWYIQNMFTGDLKEICFTQLV